MRRRDSMKHLDGMSEYERRSLRNQEKALDNQERMLQLQEQANDAVWRLLELSDAEWVGEYRFERTNPTPHQRKSREMVAHLAAKRSA